MRAHGLALSSEMAYLRKGLGRQMAQTAADMAEEGVLQRIRVGDQEYYSTTENLISWSRSSLARNYESCRHSITL